MRCIEEYIHCIKDTANYPEDIARNFDKIMALRFLTGDGVSEISLDKKEEYIGFKVKLIEETSSQFSKRCNGRIITSYGTTYEVYTRATKSNVAVHFNK